MCYAIVWENQKRSPNPLVLYVIFLREAHGNKTLVLLQGARRASTPSPEGEEYEPFRASS